MRKMKDSGIEWIGEIPEGWSVKRVKHVFYRKNKKAMQDNPVILSLARSGVHERDISGNEGQIAESYYNYNPVDIDDLLINPMDLYSGANCSISKVKGVISPAYINLRYKSGINPIFFDYYFKLQYWQMAFFSYGKGVSYENRWTLTTDTLMNYPVVVPDYSEQCAITDFLTAKCTKIDSIIEKQQQIIEKLKAYKLSLITETVTKGLNPDVKMKDSGVEWIGKIPENWDIGKIKNFCLLKTGGTPSTTHLEWFDGDIQWFTPSDFSDKYILNESNRKLSKLAIEDGVASLFPENTVMIVGIGATAGKVGFAINKSYCNQQITALITDMIFSKYLLYWLIANTKFLKETAMFTTLPILNNRTIGNYICVVPQNKIEQQQIANYLDRKCSAIDSAIEKKQAIINKLAEYKKSLIYEVVTGKKEVL